MGLKHYFSKDEDKKAKFIFNFIAPLYGIIDRSISKEYKKVSKILDIEIPIRNKSILDIGTGTGSWLVALNEYDPSMAVGVDFSKKMLEHAKLNHPELEFKLVNGGNLKAFTDDSFDIVTASYVLHGMKYEKRMQLLTEMKRVSKKYVIVHDFNGRTSPIIHILEFFERSDYINFKKDFSNELESIFEQIKIIKLKSGNAIYIGTS
ncbi:MAG: hypothetical protein DRJ05_09505 [Bacteroidetes bacterium]|nr:MAG: hypothetical protein DRJ05_09505 [Bacteroidota bacterium]